MRNIEKTINEVQVNDRYDLSVRELKELANLSENTDLYSFVYKCFKYGYALGERASKKA